jgi:hypothetical protein
MNLINSDLFELSRQLIAMPLFEEDILIKAKEKNYSKEYILEMVDKIKNSAEIKYILLDKFKKNLN